ncbi:KAP-like P-loop domain-containing protein [Halanaerobium saccharolyticum]|uniref:KAP-like P-loop domain-containing protein n=1 Tax=Halanaerobium saccharolyticum TaxID=43595 RepID=A0A4R6R766_9FIRM|nr:P-loop NTPase fold protein [Halanaerobium saccharolyticum]TDP81813.1 KAP-like P-loop domain-containing protein [Halanaerobium saccharolyticum]
MKIKLNNINIDKKDPFKEDILERKESVEILTQLISETQDSLVLAIDSLWGTGKTTFVKMWQMHLENKGFSTLYFNAWENDFNDDALIALIGEIEMAIDSFETENSKLDKIQYNFEKIKRAASVLIKNSIPIALKYASAGVLDYDDLTEKAIGEITEKSQKTKLINTRNQNIF